MRIASHTLAFGCDDQQVRELVEGIYDELRIWARALTDAEIRQAAILSSGDSLHEQEQVPSMT